MTPKQSDFPPRVWLHGDYLKSHGISISCFKEKLSQSGDIAYISIIEHQALLREARAEARYWEQLAREWVRDYTKLKEKYEPMILVPSEGVKNGDK